MGMYMCTVDEGGQAREDVGLCAVGETVRIRVAARMGVRAGGGTALVTFGLCLHPGSRGGQGVYI